MIYYDFHSADCYLQIAFCVLFDAVPPLRLRGKCRFEVFVIEEQAAQLGQKLISTSVVAQVPALTPIVNAFAVEVEISALLADSAAVGRMMKREAETENSTEERR